MTSELRELVWDPDQRFGFEYRDIATGSRECAADRETHDAGADHDRFEPIQIGIS